MSSRTDLCDDVVDVTSSSALDVENNTIVVSAGFRQVRYKRLGDPNSYRTKQTDDSEEQCRRQREVQWRGLTADDFFLKTVYIRNEQNVTDLHRPFSHVSYLFECNANDTYVLRMTHISSLMSTQDPTGCGEIPELCVSHHPHIRKAPFP